MNILLAPAHYTLDGVSSGSEFGWAYHLVETLSACPEVKLFVLTGGVRSDKRFAPNVRVVRLDQHPTLNLTPSYRLAFVARYYAAARRILRRHRIDLIHHVLPFGCDSTFNPLPLLGYTRTIPFVVGPLQAPHTVESLEERLYAQGDARRYQGISDYVQEKVGGRLLKGGRPLLAALSNETLRRSDYLVAVNEQARRVYAARAPRVPAVIIPPGIDAGRFERRVAAPQAGRLVEILYVGWLIRRKAVDLLISAVAQLAAEVPSLRLRIVGDGPQRRALEALARQYGVAEHVIFEGVVSHAHIADYYARADIFVSMSHSESFGQSLIEAMLTGLPVVSAENFGSGDIVADGDTGYLVPAGDTHELVARLRHLIVNPAVRAHVGERARRVVQQRYDWVTVGAQYIGLYRDVIQRRVGRRDAQEVR